MLQWKIHVLNPNEGELFIYIAQKVQVLLFYYQLEHLTRQLTKSISLTVLTLNQLWFGWGGKKP